MSEWKQYLLNVRNKWTKEYNIGYSNWNEDQHGEITDLFLYIGKKDDQTHIHVFWNHHESEYQWVVTCAKDHSNHFKFNNEDVETIIQLFHDGLNECFRYLYNTYKIKYINLKKKLNM